MTQHLVNLSEAARLANVSRSTISRDRRSGKISVSNDRQGKPVVAVSELVRVYGSVTQDDDSRHTQENTYDTGAGLQPQVDLLERQVRQLEGQLSASQDREKSLMALFQGVPRIESKPKRGVLGRVVRAALDIE